MKTALCLSGQPRLGSYAFRAFLDNILAGQEYDIFLFVWRRKEQSEDEVRSILDSFIGQYTRIQACVIKEQMDFPARDYATRAHQGSSIFNIQSMYYAMMMANDLKSAHEKKVGRRYDCVIRARMDLSCFIPMEMKKYQPLLRNYVFLPETSYYKPGFNDTFAFSSSENMDVLAQLPHHLDEYFRKDGVAFNPHTMLLHHTIKNRLVFAYLSIPVEIVHELPMTVIEG
jgi:hypothetical protein